IAFTSNMFEADARPQKLLDTKGPRWNFRSAPTNTHGVAIVCALPTNIPIHSARSWRTPSRHCMASTVPGRGPDAGDGSATTDVDSKDAVRKTDNRKGSLVIDHSFKPLNQAALVSHSSTNFTCRKCPRGGTGSV